MKLSPGQFIKETILKPQGLTAAEMARKMGISPSTFRDVIGGRSRISQRMAESLAAYTNTTQQSWLTQQQQYDEWKKTQG